MIQLEKVNKYIEDLKFKKKTMGGVDELDALNHMKDICDIYEEEIKRLKSETADASSSEELAKKDELIKVFKEKFEQLNEEKEKYRSLAMNNTDTQKNNEEIEVLQDTINSLMAENENYRRTAIRPMVVERKDKEIERLNSDNYELRKRISELEEKNRKAQQEIKEFGQKQEAEIQQALAIKEEYENKYNEIKELSEYIPMIKKDAQERAEAQASQIVVQANMDAQTVREESLIEKRRIENEIESIKQAKEDMKRSVLDTMQKYDELMRKISAEIDGE